MGQLPRLTLLPSAALALSCGRAVPPPRAPEFAPPGETKCRVAKSQSQPLIVEWPSSARAALEARVRRGPVAVRYTGCEMEVVDTCTLPGSYRFVGTTRKRDHVRIAEVDELWANLPVGAAGLEAELRRSGELNVTMTIIGRYETEVPAEPPPAPACEGATHVVTGLTVGAFRFVSGAAAAAGGGVRVAGAGVDGRTSAEHAVLTEDGVEQACAAARSTDAAPPEGCGALLRVEVAPLRHAAAAAGPTAAPEGATAAPMAPPADDGGADSPLASATAEPDGLVVGAFLSAVPYGFLGRGTPAPRTDYPANNYDVITTTSDTPQDPVGALVGGSLSVGFAASSRTTVGLRTTLALGNGVAFLLGPTLEWRLAEGLWVGGSVFGGTFFAPAEGTYYAAYSVDPSIRTAGHSFEFTASGVGGSAQIAYVFAASESGEWMVAAHPAVLAGGAVFVPLEAGFRWY